MKKIVLHYGLIACIFIVTGIMFSCKGDDPVLPPPEPPIGVPSNLSYSIVTQGVRVEWGRVENIDGYEVCVSDTGQIYSTTSTWYTFPVSLNGALNYETQYTWKVRAIKGEKKGDWATASLTTMDLPTMYKFLGTWLTDSIYVNASLGGNAFPVEQFLPGAISPPTNDVDITIAQDGSNEAILFSITGIDSFLPVEQQSLNNVPMQSNGDASIIGSQTVNYTYTYTFEEPVQLKDLPGYDQMKEQAGQFGSLLDGAAIEAIQLTVNDANITGTLFAPNKAHYTIQLNAPVKITTTNPLVDLGLSYYFQNNPLITILDIYSTKE